MSKAPKLRFKEFSGDWEEKKLGKLGEFKKTYSFSRNVEGEGNYKHIHYGDIHMNYNGIISKDKYIPSIDIPSDDSYEFIKERDIIFADASEDRKDLGKVAVVRDIEGNVLSGLHTICFRPNESLNSEFFLNHSLNKEYLKFMYTRGNGAKVLGISKSNLSEYKFLAPSKEEQEKIASFFSLIDDKISLQSEKVEALKDYKKGMMQKIFSRELRFKDDEGRDYPEWEEKKLGEITNLTDGVHFTPEYVESGVPFWSVETIVSNSKPKYITEEAHKDAIRRCYPKKGDILLTRIGTLAVPKLVDWDDEFSIYVSVALIKSSDKYNSKFAKYYFESEEYQKDFLSKSLLTATPKKINMEDLKQTKIKLPVLEEQEKIGMLLSSIEQKIVNEEEKLYSLNEYKKGLLQQMFV